MHINLTAPINSLGYGVVGLNVALALERSPTNEPALWCIGNIDAPQRHHAVLRVMMERTQSYDRNSPSLRIYHQFDLAHHVGKGMHVGMPIFELTRFKPNERHHLKQQDVIVANSAWAQTVLVDAGIPPALIDYMPLGVDKEIFHPGVVPLPAFDARKNTTIFLNVGKWEIRKGHDVLVDAFNKAFTKQDDVMLVMNCFNPCFNEQEKLVRYNQQWADLYRQSPLGDNIVVFPGRLGSQEEVAGLMASVDCGVFPSRAEGWGLETAEMLAMGKHVITTNYSAHTEFCSPKNARLIEIDHLEDAHDGIWFQADDPAWGGQPGQWAALEEPQVDQLVDHMRAIHRAKQAGELKRNDDGIRSSYSWDDAISIMGDSPFRG